MPDRIERRRQPRVKVRWPVTVLTDDSRIEAETINITIGGLFICCDQPLHVNEMFRLRISPPNYRTIVASGRAIWSDLYAIDDQRTPVGIGLCFVRVSDRDRQFLKDVISAHSG